MLIEKENENKYFIAQMKVIFLALILSININPCHSILKPKNVNKMFILFSNQITLKIDTGNDYFAQVLYYTSKIHPSEVRLNGNIENLDNGRIEVEMKENTVILKFSSPLQNCEKMFKDCSRINEIDLSDFDSSEVDTIINMFEGCKRLTSINFGNFDTSKVVRFNNMFESCEELRSLDLSNFDTSSCTMFSQMFYNCKNLQYLYLTNFNTSIAKEMNYMFSGCSSLYSLNLSSFNTEEVLGMECMFDHCSRLYSLDLTSFNLKSIVNVQNMFSYCNHLSYIKIKDTFLFSVSVKYADITKETSENLHFCVEDLVNSNTNTKTDCSSCSIDKSNLELFLVKKINLCCYPSCQECEEQGNDENHKCKTCKSNYNLEVSTTSYKNCYINQCTKLFYLDSGNKINCISELDCPSGYNKLIEDRNKCIQRCDLDNQYKYEYENKCYDKCPEGTEESKTTALLCEKKQSAVIVEPTQINPAKESKINTDIYYIEQDNQEIQVSESNLLKEDEVFFRKVFDNLTFGLNMSELDSKKEIIFEQNNLKYIISTTDFQKRESNKSTIDLGNCEIKLKNNSNIPLEETLYIFKIEFNINGMKIPKTEYEVYYLSNTSQFVKLNLSICQNEKIIISHPFEINNNIDKYNPKSGYYNDICYTTTSENGTDITLSDRKEEFIKNNMTLCEEDCTFIKYDYSNNKSVCSCEIKINIPIIMTEIKFDKKKLYKSFTDIKNIANVLIIKCYKLLFSKKGISFNYGVYILIPIIILFIFCTIIFLSCSYNKLNNKIEFIIYSKENWKKLKEIYNKSKNKINKNYANKNNNKNKINKNYNNSNKNKILNLKKNKIKNNKNLFTENNINSKKALIRKRNVGKTSKKAQPIKLNQGPSLVLFNNNNQIINNHNNNTYNIKKNKRIIKRSKRNLIQNKISQERGKKLKISGLNNIQKFELIQKIMAPNDFELNNLNYQEALKKDKRSYTQYYISLLRTNHLFIFSFIQNKDYNSKELTIILFLFIFTLNFIVNALFFNDSTMHVIYEEKGKFNFLYQIPQILYSSLICGILTVVIRNLSLTEKDILYEQVPKIN